MSSVRWYGVGLRAGDGFRPVWALVLLLACAPGVFGQEAPDGGESADTVQAVEAGSERDEAALDALAAEVAADLRCPVCRNQSVLESSAELSREMHTTIRSKLAAGESPEQVKAYFVERYGEWILLKPTARGVNMAVYALPALVLLLGGAFLVLRLRGWARHEPAAGGAPPPGGGEPDSTVRVGGVTAAAGPNPAPGKPASRPTGPEEFSQDDQRWLDEAVRRS